MANQKKNKEPDQEIEREQAAVKRLRDYAGGKPVYEQDGALKDIALILVSLCERNDAMLSLLLESVEQAGQMADAIGALEDFVYDDECGCDFDGGAVIETDADETDGVYHIACPSCQADMEIMRETLMMEAALRCPSCQAEIEVTPLNGCGCGGCKH